ncbi:MAG TPA: c-type cytochrome [Geminicoccaceae bacterium]
MVWLRSTLLGIAGALVVNGDGGTLSAAALSGHGGPVKGVAVAEDGRRALTAGFDYSLILWDLERETVTLRLHGHDAAVNAVAFLPDGERALSASDDGTLALWDLKRGTLIRQLLGHEAKVVDVALDAEGGLAASAGWDRTVRLWDLENGAPPVVLAAPANLNSVAFSADGEQVLAGDSEGSLFAWRVADGTQLMSAHRHDFAITSLALHAASGSLASASVDETVQLWDLATGEVTQTLFGHEGPVLAVDLSPDGELVASGGMDGSVRVWRRGDGDRLRVFERHGGPVWSVAFGEDGETLLSGGADGLVVTHDLAARTEPGVPAETPPAPASGVAAPFDDGSRGAKLFRTCAACHTLTPDGGHRAGPTLHNLFGRPAGGHPGYPYSEALKSADLVWTEETVSRLFEVGPETLVPGSKMPLQRMPDPADRAALIAWLKDATAPDAPPPGDDQGEGTGP